MSLLEGLWKCAKCGYILSSEQYVNAKFENCPRCGTHLSNYNRIIKKVVLDDLPILKPVIKSKSGLTWYI
jgi:ribosomal protein S27AE